VSRLPDRIRPRIRDVDSYGISDPLGSNAVPKGMARNRSVELELIVPGRPPIQDRDEKWGYARQYLEDRVGAVVGSGPDDMWTPTQTGVLKLMPRYPISEILLPDYYGANVPDPENLCREIPASSCMPPLHSDTVNILGDLLETRYENEQQNLTEGMIRQVVDGFIGYAEEALAKRNYREARLLAQADAGGTSAVQQGLERFYMAERLWFREDNTCMWRYVR